jgi:anti-sigma factor RsiW
MFRFTCRYCEARLTAFIHGELPLKARRRIARHLDECPTCYARYLRRRDLADELSRHIPRIGQPERGQLQRVWSGIQAEMTPTPRALYLRRSPRYGLVTLVLLLVMLLPLTMGNQNVAFSSVPTQAFPAAASTGTPKIQGVLTKSVSPAAIALMTSDRSTGSTNPYLQNTPEPNG